MVRHRVYGRFIAINLVNLSRKHIKYQSHTPKRFVFAGDVGEEARSDAPVVEDEVTLIVHLVAGMAIQHRIYSVNNCLVV